MQIIGTNVVGQSDGKTTVEFKGEGGELISVVLASDGLEDAAAVRRARNGEPWLGVADAGRASASHC